ncbi:hypothetical protein K438DRAFT_1925863 [Mycena galopus ATCC 62051]|nr:hypothetical protein K438DRAFT_1925863 [Mycena galopus ATCC 62051]
MSKKCADYTHSRRPSTEAFLLADANLRAPATGADRRLKEWKRRQRPWMRPQSPVSHVLYRPADCSDDEASVGPSFGLPPHSSEECVDNLECALLLFEPSSGLPHSLGRKLERGMPAAYGVESRALDNLPSLKPAWWPGNLPAVAFAVRLVSDDNDSDADEIIEFISNLSVELGMHRADFRPEAGMDMRGACTVLVLAFGVVEGSPHIAGKSPQRREIQAIATCS